MSASHGRDRISAVSAEDNDDDARKALYRFPTDYFSGRSEYASDMARKTGELMPKHNNRVIEMESRQPSGETSFQIEDDGEVYVMFRRTMLHLDDEIAGIAVMLNGKELNSNAADDYSERTGISNNTGTSDLRRALMDLTEEDLANMSMEDSIHSRIIQNLSTLSDDEEVKKIQSDNDQYSVYPNRICLPEVQKSPVAPITSSKKSEIDAESKGKAGPSSNRKIRSKRNEKEDGDDTSDPQAAYSAGQYEFSSHKSQSTEGSASSPQQNLLPQPSIKSPTSIMDNLEGRLAVDGEVWEDEKWHMNQVAKYNPHLYAEPLKVYEQDWENYNFEQDDSSLGDGSTSSDLFVYEPSICNQSVLAFSPEKSSIRNHRSIAVYPSKSVTFGFVQVRKYERILDVNPSTKSGPSLGIGWNYEAVEIFSIADYVPENIRQKWYEDTTRPFPVIRLNAIQRFGVVTDLGYSKKEVRQAVRRNRKARNQRQRTVENLYIDEKIEKVREKAKRILFWR